MQQPPLPTENLQSHARLMCECKLLHLLILYVFGVVHAEPTTTLDRTLYYLTPMMNP